VVGWLILVAFALVPFAIGFSGIRFRRLPMIAVALLCLGYLALVVCSGIWAATCPHCSAGELRRDAAWVMGVAYYGVVTALLLSIMALGALAAWLVRRRVFHAQAHPSRARNEAGNQG
jgi:hypothetical protein